mgnify:CR=1 FL=1
MPRKSKIAFIEPLLTASMILERHIDGFIRQANSDSYGLTQFKILLSIQRSKKSLDCCQASIAQLWGISEAAVSRQIGILAKDKLITRSSDPDEMRKTVLGLTAKGKTFVSKTMRMVDKELSRIFKPVSKTTKGQLATHLYKVLESLSKNTLY